MPDLERRRRSRHRETTLDDVMDRLDDLALGLYLLHGESHYLTHLEESEMADLTALRAQVEENTSIEASAVTLLGELAQLIRDNATDPEALAALAADLDSSGSDLAAAVAANTPLDTEPETPGDAPGPDDGPGTPADGDSGTPDNPDDGDDTEAPVGGGNDTADGTPDESGTTSDPGDNPDGEPSAETPGDTVPTPPENATPEGGIPGEGSVGDATP